MNGLGGLITGDLIMDTIGDLSAKTFYLCGPQGMYDFCVPELERVGIPEKEDKERGVWRTCQYMRLSGMAGRDKGR